MYIKRTGTTADKSGRGRTEQAQRMAAITFLATLFVTLGIGLVAAYLIWPSGIGGVPLASLTLGMLARAVSSIGVVILTLGIIAGALWFWD
ncbi:MAG: hypothetical protein A3G81_10185 [Betaproteobacteria bacterium RIFCSPLOWO2_12_FULL_65_14]|nr:MAG: hypothetical protein A3G81_10185 [Betaproteobacteria bacterium RIFCSPLOWO2_12_FULL_65_14]